MAATVSVRERDLSFMPASWAGDEAENLILCFPKGLQRCSSCTSWMQPVVWLLSPPGYELLPLQVSGLVWVHCPRTERAHLPPPGYSWVHRSQLCIPPGQGAAPLGFCLSQGSGVLRVIHQFLRCDKLCGQTLCGWEKLLLLWPFTIGVRVKISSKVKKMSDGD